MNNTIQIFENKEFGAIRTMSDEQGESLFCGKDVARALGYKNPEKALRVHIEDDDKVVNKMDTTYGIKPTTFINESGLYSLILSSKLLNKNTSLKRLSLFLFCEKDVTAAWGIVMDEMWCESM